MLQLFSNISIVITPKPFYQIFFHLRVALVLRFVFKQMIYKKKPRSPLLQGAGAAERHVLK